MNKEPKYDPLAIRSYNSVKKEFYFQDFLKNEGFISILKEVNAGKCDLTPAGIEFITDYHGFRTTARLMTKYGFKLHEFEENPGPENVKSYENWLKEQEVIVNKKYANTFSLDTTGETPAKKKVIPMGANNSKIKQLTIALLAIAAITFLLIK